MNPRIKLIPASVRPLLHRHAVWMCAGAGACGLGETPFAAYVCWYRLRIEAIVR